MSIFDDIFDDIEKMFKKFREKSLGQMSSGYSISVTYGPDGKPIVNVETYGDVDKETLRREIERQYPNAKIIGLDKELIKEVSEEKIEHKRESDYKKKGKDRLGPTEIRWVDE